MFRATCALWAEELRYNEDVTWPDVCKAISWANSVTLLRQDAMNRLVRLRREDPEGILPEAERKLKELQNGKKGKQ